MHALAGMRPLIAATYHPLTAAGSRSPFVRSTGGSAVL
jgi:hypothetical protein